MSKSIARLLIPSHGPRALRIARACRRMGIVTVGLVDTSCGEAALSPSSKGNPSSATPDDSSTVLPRLDGDAESAIDSYLSLDFRTLTAETLEKSISEASIDAVHMDGSPSLSSAMTELFAQSSLTRVGPREPAVSMETYGDFAAIAEGFEGAPLVGHHLQCMDDARELRKHSDLPWILHRWRGPWTTPQIVHRWEDVEKLFATAGTPADGTSQPVLEAPEKPHSTTAGGNDGWVASPWNNGSRILAVPTIRFGDGDAFVLHERDETLLHLGEIALVETPSPLYLQSTTGEQQRDALFDVALAFSETIQHGGIMTCYFVAGPDSVLHMLPPHFGLSPCDTPSELASGINFVEQQVFVARGEKPASEVFARRRSGHAFAAGIQSQEAVTDEMARAAIAGLRMPPAVQGRVRLDKEAHLLPENSSGSNVPLLRVTTYAPRRLRSLLLMDRTLKGILVPTVKNNRDSMLDMLSRESFRAGLI